ncbi:MAG: glycosyltransferase family 4 protein [Pleurocapsa sp. MO_226.B13]|nr:glycosyltransferase family 4 protein [Pleurocapsa sp. MO_226.B13]
MRILSAHNRYQIRGGEDESCESEQRLLREMGHLVDVYQENNDRISSLSKLQLALRTIWSTETYKTVSAQLQTTPYDLVHVQNFFPLISPSIYYAAQNKGIPVIQTLRNYRLLCPNALFFRDGKVCEDCMGKPIPYPGILNSCYRGNTTASIATAATITIHRALDTWSKTVDRFICLTHFARNKFIEGGFPANKIVVKPNFVHPDPGIGYGAGGYALFVGRLSVEKGLDTLLDAWEILDNPCPLIIVGDGPLAEQVLQATQANSNIEWLGRRPMAEVHELMGNANFLIFPSKWYETFGRVAIEAFAKGTPVVASNIGAIAELINHGQTGILFAPGNAKDLADKVDWCLSNQSKLAQMRPEARHEFESKFTAEANYKMMMEIYAAVLDEK